jgi:hypothetical protein
MLLEKQLVAVFLFQSFWYCDVRALASAKAFRFFGGYSGRVTPDPIPNSEVKPACADGTA